MIFGEGRIKDVYRKVLWGPGVQGLAALPKPWEHRLVRLLGRGASALARHKRVEVRDNLARAFPDGRVDDGRSIENVAQDVFAAHFANQYIGLSFSGCTEETWPEYLQWKGLDVLRAHAAQGRGVVIAHPHMGPAQLPLHVLGRMGFGMVQVGGGRVTRVSLSETGEWARRRRTVLEGRMPVRVHDGRSYLRPLLRELEEGALVMTAADGTGGGDELGRRLERTVLGAELGIPVGPIWMALRSGAPLLTLHCYRNPEPGSLYIAEIGAEIPLDKDLPMSEVFEDGADHLALWLDRVLRAHPGDWLFWDGFAPGALLR